MKLKNKILSGVAAGMLVLGLSAAPAHADVSNNTVTNRSIGGVWVQLDNGSKVMLLGYGAKVNNVDWLIVQKGSCVIMGVKKYCAPYAGIQVAVNNNAQVFVQRIS